MSRPTLEELVENFALFDDWEERYKYLIDLGKTLPDMDDALKVEQNLVKGCTSRVWLFKVEKEAGEGQKTQHFIMDSDAHIVRGLIAILLSAYQDKTSEEIANIDIEGAFRQMELDEHLSPNRRNGFYAMVAKITA